MGKLIPTALPLSPQDIHPDELKVILAEASVRHREATKALEAAQDLFDAADRQRAYALTEKQKLAAREERFRIDKLRSLVPVLDNDAETMRTHFRNACAEETVDPDETMSVHQWFLKWAQYRVMAHRAREAVIRYDMEQDRDGYISWVRRIAGWNQLIGAVTSVRRGGVRFDGDDIEGLAEVNARIAEESKDAPIPLTREADDNVTPMPEDLGISDPAAAGFQQYALSALEFAHEYSKAVDDAAKAWSTQNIKTLAEQAQKQFRAQAADAIEQAEAAALERDQAAPTGDQG